MNKTGFYLLKCLADLIVTCLLVGLGALIAGLFGISFKTEEMRYEWILLIGAVVFLITFLLSNLLVRRIRILIQKKEKSNAEESV